MTFCKKHFIAAGLFLTLPLFSWAEAPVVDDSDNFAIIDDQQFADHPKYGSSKTESAPITNSSAQKYQMEPLPDDDGPALVKEEQGSTNASANNVNASATLIDKIQTLQQEIQELRGQLEVQAHDLKLLQQQQLSFYKDLDSRLANPSGKPVSIKPATDLTIAASPPKAPITMPAKAPTPIAKNTVTPAVVPASHTNPADEQISYLAAYELVKNKRNDEAVTAMNTFVQRYPHGAYTANAEYWLGELFMVKQDYSQAIKHFETVLQQFPSSPKTAASMLKAGYAYAASGKNAEAKKYLQQVVNNYPGTPTAQLAHLKLESINAL